MTSPALPKVATVQTKFGHRSPPRSAVGKINSGSVGVTQEAASLVVSGELGHEGDIDDVVLAFIQRLDLLEDEQNHRENMSTKKMGFKS